MLRLPPRSTRTDTLFPYTTLFRSIRHVLLDSRGRDFGVDGGKPDRAADDQDKQGDEDRGKRRPAPPGRGESVTHAAPFAPARRSLYSPGGMPTALPRIDPPTVLVGLMVAGLSTLGKRPARRMVRGFVDSDQANSRAWAQTIPET